MSIMSWTRDLMIADVRRLLREKTAGRFADVDLERWSDEGILEVCTRTRCLRSSFTAAAVSGQANYSIPTNLLGAWAISRVEFNSVELEKAAFDDVEELLQTGETLATLKTPRYWCPLGREIVLVPTPATTDTIRVWGAKKAEALSGGPDTLANLGIDESYGPAVEDFMLHRGLTMAGKFQESMVVWQGFERKVGVTSDKTMPDTRGESTRGSG